MTTEQAVSDLCEWLEREPVKVKLTSGECVRCRMIRVFDLGGVRYVYLSQTDRGRYVRVADVLEVEMC